MTVNFAPRFNDFSPLIAGVSKQTLTWDFSSALASGQTLQGTPTVTITLISGTDNNPQANLIAGPQIGTAPGGTTNCAVIAQVGPFPVAGPPMTAGNVNRYQFVVSCPVTPNSVSLSDVISGFDYVSVIAPPTDCN